MCQDIRHAVAKAGVSAVRIGPFCAAGLGIESFQKSSICECRGYEQVSSAIDSGLMSRPAGAMNFLHESAHQFPAGN